MQTTDTISSEQLKEIADAIFGQGPVVVREHYSDYECQTREFRTADALMKDMIDEPIQDRVLFSYAIYYPEAKGFVYEERIKLIPKKCHGHTFRFSQNGWGLIGFQCDFRHPPRVKCRIAVNSRARAMNWHETYAKIKKPDLWDWKIIEKKAGKLVRLLRTLGTTVGQNDLR